jgi:hypothetical protein
LTITAEAKDSTGFIGSDEVTITITGTAILTGMKIYPEINPLHLSSDSSVPLIVYGTYDDGNMRNITASGCGTTYSSSNLTAVEVSPEGVLSIKSQGGSVITIQNSGVQKTITVVGEVGACSTWEAVISKYQDYVSGQADWTDVIECYTGYASQ